MRALTREQLAAMPVEAVFAYFGWIGWVPFADPNDVFLVDE